MYSFRTRKIISAVNKQQQTNDSSGENLSVSANDSSEFTLSSFNSDTSTDSSFKIWTTDTPNFTSNIECSNELLSPINYDVQALRHNDVLELSDNVHVGSNGSQTVISTKQIKPSFASPMTSTNIANLQVVDEIPKNITDHSKKSSLPRISVTNNITKTTSKRRKHHCLYCDISVHNFARHVERWHSDEVEVQRFMSLPKNDPTRKKILDKIRKEGDFTSGTFVAVQEKMKNKFDESSSSNLLPCIHCKGYYGKSTLRRHVSRCFYNKNKKPGTRQRHQSESHTLLSGYFGPHDPLRTSGVLGSLKADEISLVAKKDKIICEVARRYIKCHKQKHLGAVAKRYMRHLARLLIEVRKIEQNNSLSLFSLLHPAKFKTIIRALRSITVYDSTTKMFSSPSLALQMGTLLKAAIKAAYSLELQKDINSPNLNVLNIMKKLIEDEWSTEVSTEACQNLNEKRFNKPTVLPLAEDLAKLKTYLDNMVSEAQNALNAKNDDEKAYKTIVQGAYCNLLLFNKRRVGELQRILLHTYEAHVNEEAQCGDFDKLLSPCEQILIKKLKRIVIPGKRGRGVPVLFDENTKKAIDLTIKFRDNFCTTGNKYLFPTPNTESPISGYHVFRKLVIKVLDDPKKTSSLTSTRLRKHLATISQILKMNNEDLEQLASFMGHTTKTHQEWYRLPQDLYQTAKVAKVLLMSQKTSIEAYKGKGLDELNVDMDTFETNEEENSGSEAADHEMIEATTSQISEIETENSKKKRKKTVNKWSLAEKEAAESFFKSHIKKRIAPKKNEVLDLMKLYPTLFVGRKYDSIKVYICNQYNKQR